MSVIVSSFSVAQLTGLAVGPDKKELCWLLSVTLSGSVIVCSEAI